MTAIVLISLAIPVVHALTEEEAAASDFTVATAGHGVVDRAFRSGDAWITAGVGCRVAARNAKDGALMWRRNACDGNADVGEVMVASSATDAVVVLDPASGVLRGHDAATGDALFDALVVDEGGRATGMWRVDDRAVGVATTTATDGRVSFGLRSATDGRPLGRPWAVKDSLAGLRRSDDDEEAIVLGTSGDNDGRVLVGWVRRSDGSTDLSRAVLVNASGTTRDPDRPPAAVSRDTSRIKASSLVLFRNSANGALNLVGERVAAKDPPTLLYAEGLESHAASTRDIPLSTSRTNSIKHFIVTDDDHAAVSFVDDPSADDPVMTTVLVPLTNAVSSSSTDDLVSANACGDRTLLWKSDGQLSLSDTVVSLPDDLLPPEPVARVFAGVGGDDDNEMCSVLLTTTRGTTVGMMLSSDSTSVTSSWRQEESLGGVSQAMLLDVSDLLTPSTAAATTTTTTTTTIDLSFEARLYAQRDEIVHSLHNLADKAKSLFSPSSGSSEYDDRLFARDARFGLAKVAVLLNSEQGRLIGMDTFRQRGHVVWALNLPRRAVSHTLVRGGPSNRLSVEGRTHAPGGRHVLVLSALDDDRRTEWRCVDGLTGDETAKGTVHATSKTARVVPVLASDHNEDDDVADCPQAALLLAEDGSVTVVPPNANVAGVVSGARNGLHAHTLDRETGTFRSYQLRADADDDSKRIVSELTAETRFGPRERVLNVAYPPRGEVWSAPATITGDDSLLLKYHNPHLVVVVTHADQDEDGEQDAFAKALADSVSGGGGSKKKPLGVTPNSSDRATTKTTPTPNFYVNLVDSVTARVLYRVSHTNASSHHPVPVVLTENWILYSFLNSASKRTDLGVLTLHEGMIGRNDITAFSTRVEQDLGFSSRTSPTPVVLHKVYTLQQPKVVTALGVTRTARGIASKRLVLAHDGGQIVSVDRRRLDPRRPSADPRPAEVAEGLAKYAPVLPMVPRETLTHGGAPVEGATTVVSESAHVESHSSLLAHGGPDLFFARVSPSKGFDLLPDDFNKGVLVVVVLGLCAVYAGLTRTNAKAAVRAAWA